MGYTYGLLVVGGMGWFVGKLVGDGVETFVGCVWLKGEEEMQPHQEDIIKGVWISDQYQYKSYMSSRRAHMGVCW